MDKITILKPVLSEKAYAVSQARNTYVFAVPHDANKHTIARAVAAQFEVTVLNVNVTNIAGKAKRTVRKSGRAMSGRQSDIRKAYVTLKAGDSLPIFAAMEEDSKDAPAISTDKKAEKKNENGKEK